MNRTPTTPYSVHTYLSTVVLFKRLIKRLMDILLKDCIHPRVGKLEHKEATQNVRLDSRLRCASAVAHDFFSFNFYLIKTPSVHTLF